MAKKGAKICCFYYEYNELDSLAHYLEKQAAKGWELTNKTGAWLGFRRAEPKTVKVSVELVYSNDNDLDNEEFIAFCKAAGWDHIFSDGKIQIFSTEDMNAPSINTEPELKLEKIRKKALVTKRVLNGIILALLVFFYLKIIDFNSYYTYLGYSGLTSLITLPLYGIITTMDTADCFIWYKDAKKKIACGIEPKYEKRFISRLNRVTVFVLIFGGLWGSNLLDKLLSGEKGQAIFYAVIFSVVILFILIFATYQSKHNKDRVGTMPQFMIGGVFLILVVFIGSIVVEGDFNEKYAKVDGSYQQVYDDKLELTLEDLGIKLTGYQDTSANNSINFLLKEYSGEDFSKNAEEYTLHYDVYITKNKKIYDMVLNQRFLDEDRLQKEETNDVVFAAKETYVSGNQRTTLLLYDDRIISITTSINLNEQQKRTIKDKLLAL